MRWCLLAMLSVTIVGCRAYHLDVDGRIERRASEPIDWVPDPVEAVQPPPKTPTVAEPTGLQLLLETPPPATGNRVEPAEARAADGSNRMIVRIGDVQPTGPKEPGAKGQSAKNRSMVERLQMPEVLKVYGGPDIKLPPSTAPREEIDAAIKKQFPPLPGLPDLPAANMGPNGLPMTLADLQQHALRGNPTIRQAHHEVDAARGNALQVGLYPNTVVGYEGDTLGQANAFGQRSAGQQGVFLEQTIKTGRKLELARQAAERDVLIAEQKVKQVESEVQTQVRNGYFAHLSARKNFEVSRALAQLTDEVFNVLLLQLQAGEVAAYEPMQIRVLAMQSRGLLVQSFNRYIASWKQLAAATGSPNLALTEVAGRIDMPVPHFEYDAVLESVLRNHSDVVTATLSVERDRTLLRLAEAQPIPDVNLHLSLLKDTTSFPHYPMQNVFASIPVPIFNRNQGGIQMARATLHRSLLENARVRNDLSARVAEVFNRYENNRLLLDMYKTQMLPNQVQAFRAAVARHAAVGDKSVSYNDVVTAQQNLANLLNSYLTALSDQWTSVNDIGNLLQTKDLFQTRSTDEVAAVPDVQTIIREVRPHRPRREALSERLRLPVTFAEPR